MTKRLLVIERDFPHLLPDDYVKYCPKDVTYNCIAYAAGDTTQFWDGYGVDPGFYWPGPPGELLVHLIEAYRAVGFKECHSSDLEAGFEKVALYKITDKGDELWTHAARLRDDGWWESKIGRSEDILHRSPRCLEGHVYGEVAKYMRRRISDRIRQRLLRWLMAKKKEQDKMVTNKDDQSGSLPHRNKPIRIPLDFDKAIEGLLNVKPNSKMPKPDK
jgi:hypothetical protein